MEEFVKGGAFLIESISPQAIFTPEEFSEEQRLIGKAATEFVVGEVQPQLDDIETQKEGLLPSLVKKAGELGLLSGDITEEDGGQGLEGQCPLNDGKNVSRRWVLHGGLCCPYRHWFSSHYLFRK